MGSPPALRTLRQLLAEIRTASPTGKLADNPAASYILNQYRKYNVTDQQLCKAQQEMDFMAKTYLCYLQSSRRYHQINETFHGKGERSVEETAKLVGFKLPHDPK